jgi:hypothetical protein
VSVFALVRDIKEALKRVASVRMHVPVCFFYASGGSALLFACMCMCLYASVCVYVSVCMPACACVCMCLFVCARG